MQCQRRERTHTRRQDRDFAHLIHRMLLNTTSSSRWNVWWRWSNSSARSCRHGARSRRISSRLDAPEKDAVKRFMVVRLVRLMPLAPLPPTKVAPQSLAHACPCQLQSTVACSCLSMSVSILYSCIPGFMYGRDDESEDLICIIDA